MMNAYFVIILAALLFEFALGVVANALNLRALRPEAPAALQGVYEPDEYGRSQEYTRVTTRFEYVTGTFKLLLLLAFWFLGGFNSLDQAIRQWDLIPVVNGLLFAGTLFLGFMLVTLPFSVYRTFVIEERFGFNKTTPRTFVLDRLKGLLLLAALGGPLLAGILAFFQYAGALAWLYCWTAVALFSLIVQFVAPTWIMPLFNKFTPLEPGELRDMVFQYARKVDLALDNVFVMDGSKRSSRSNAFFTGFGRNKRIALFDTLVKKHTPREMVAVLAHEIGHYKMRHIQQGIVISIAHTGVLFYLLSVFLDSSGLYEAFFMEEQSIYAGMIFFGLLYTPIELALSAALNMVSRRHEYQADRWGAETIDRPEDLVDALRKLSADNLSNLAPHPLYVFLNYTHPPLLQRVQAIEREARRVSSSPLA